MYERCSFLAYEAVDEILGQPNLLTYERLP